MTSLNIDLLYKKFKSARNSEDKCAILLDVIKIREEILQGKGGKSSLEKLQEMLISDVLFYQALKLLGKGDIKNAEFYFNKYLEALGVSSPNQFHKELFCMHYALARINYMNKNYTKALETFAYSTSIRKEVWGDVDELVYFYCANCLAMLEKFDAAAHFYEEVLKIKSDFPEVKHNLEIVKNHTNKNLTLELYSLWNSCAWQDVPIFINARDRVGVMKQLIDWLLDAGYRNLIILDNNSTYTGLLDYYSELEKDSRIKIIRLGKNLGFKAIWKSGVLEDLKISTPYVYTDPDVIPVKKCPKDFVKQLLKILNEHREFRKVGLALVYEDITFYDKEKCQETESDLCKRSQINKYLAYANTDTTFALYSNTRNYSLRLSLRTLGDMRLKHLPWYFDYDNLPEDEKYYMEHADRNSITSVQDKVIEKE